MEDIVTTILIALYIIAFVGGIILYSQCGRTLASMKKCLTPAAVSLHAFLDFPKLQRSVELATKKHRNIVTITFSLVFLLLGIFGLLALSLGYFVCFLAYRGRISFANDDMAKEVLLVLVDFLLPDMEEEFVLEYTDFVFAQKTGYNWKVSKWRSRSE